MQQENVLPDRELFSFGFFSLIDKMSVLQSSTEAENATHLNIISHLGVTE